MNWLDRLTYLHLHGPIGTEGMSALAASPRFSRLEILALKNARIGAGSAVPHFSYIGDAVIGANVNIGAGTITANWDGFEKHPTEIGDRAYVSCDTIFIAPVRIGSDASSWKSVTTELSGARRERSPVLTFPAGEIMLPAEIALTTSSGDI